MQFLKDTLTKLLLRQHGPRVRSLKVISSDEFMNWVTQHKVRRRCRRTVTCFLGLDFTSGARMQAQAFSSHRENCLLGIYNIR